MPNRFLILLVEDNADDEDLTRLALRKKASQIRVEVARDGFEAIKRLTDSSATLPNLVLLDLNLPKISGLEVLTRLRENKRTTDLLVIVLSSPYEPDDLRAAYKRLANGSIEKPITYEAIQEILKSLDFDDVH